MRGNNRYRQQQCLGRMILYKLTFPNGKSYIGITSKSLEWRIDRRKHALYGALRKYLSFKSEILVVTNDWDYLCELEKRAIAVFKTKAPLGYNLSDGGEGILGVERTPEVRERMSKAQNGIFSGRRFGLGDKHTEDARKKISEAGRGRIFSDETRKKIGLSKIGNKYNIGRVCSPETKRKIAEPQIGRPKSEETKKKMSLAKKGKPWSEARRTAQKRKERV